MTRNLSYDKFGRPIKALTNENGTSQTNPQDTYGRIDQPIQGTASEFIEENKKLKQEIVELKKSSELLQRILINAPFSVIVRDADGRYLLVNPQYEKNTGFSAEEVLGQTPHDLFKDEVAKKIIQYDRQVLEIGESMQTEKNYVINNEERTFLSVSAPLMDSNKKPFAVCIMGTDITDHKRVEKALRESENRYRRITESITDFIFTVDVRNDCLQESVHSSACLAITGYDPEEFKSDPSLWSRLVHEDDRSLVQDHVRVLEGQEVSSIEHRIIRKDAQIRWVKNTLVPYYDEYGDLQFHDSLVRDITEQKQAEEEKKKLQAELQQAQKMEAIGTLAGGIAHDFNNILSIVVGNVELALLGIPEGSKARQNLERTFTASMRARDLIKQILVFSRQSEKKLMPCDIRPILKESVRLLRAFIPTSIEIRQSIPSQIDTIMTDPTQIDQVLINLSSNAAHAMRQDGGVLDISLENTEIDEKNIVSFRDLKPGRYVKLSISDTGIGMTPDIMDKIFDPYFTTKKAGEGTGMGLAVVHGILKKHGGGITVSSTVGKGTIFNMYFPCINKGFINEKETPQMKISMGNERILFVDDEEAVVQIAQEMLEQFGYQVTTKTDSMEAFRTFRENPSHFDLLFTDQTMPKLTGVNLAEKVMGIRPDIPVILSTGYSDMINEDEISAVGIRGFIMKPFVINELTQKIRGVLDSE